MNSLKIDGLAELAESVDFAGCQQTREGDTAQEKVVAGTGSARVPLRASKLIDVRV